jgi:hypothetical protein
VGVKQNVMPNVECAAQNANQHKKEEASVRRRA